MNGEGSTIDEVGKYYMYKSGNTMKKDENNVNRSVNSVNDGESTVNREKK